MQIFALHAVDIYHVKISIRETWDDRLGISPDRMYVLHLAVAEVLYGEVVHIPCLLDRGDIGSWSEHTRELERRVSICGADLEDMLRIFFFDESFEILSIFFGDVWDLMLYADLFETLESESEDL